MAGDTSGSLQLQTNNGTTAVTIDTSQNVGIGTASPSAKLDVSAGQILAGPVGNNALVLNSSGANYGFISNQSTGVWSLGYGTTIGTLATPVLNWNSSGNVGIGTSSPSAKLHMMTASGSTALTMSTNGNQNNNFTIVNDATNGIFASNYGSTGVKVKFALNMPDNAMTLDSSGNLLLGQTVRGNVDANSFEFDISNAQAYYQHITGTGTGTAYINFNYGAVKIGSITQNGTTATAYNTSSDYRLKENVVPMTGALATVSELKPVTYKWKSDGSNGQGFIAHELAEVVPDCVTGEKDAVDAEGNPVYQGIDTSFLVATLTAAIQEQQALITQLQADVAALKGVK
jgi:hypothetical protein